jgi:hypothetical protein
MGEIIQFVPRSERERARLIQEAARYTTASSRRLIQLARRGTGLQQVIRSAAAMLIVATRSSCRDQDHRRALQSLLSGELPRADRHHLGLR